MVSKDQWFEDCFAELQQLVTDKVCGRPTTEEARFRMVCTAYLGAILLKIERRLAAIQSQGGD